MGTDLQSVLEPLLTKLWETAESKYIGDLLPDYSIADSRAAAADTEVELQKAVKENLEPELTDLVAHFRSFYPLDGYDLDPLAARFADPSDLWQTPSGDSVFCSVAQSADDVNDVESLIHSEQWSGKAAFAFRDNFLKPFKGTAAVHALCAREMAAAATTLAMAVDLAKRTVVWVCKNAIWVLGGGESPGQFPREGSRSGGNRALTMAGLLADAAALFSSLAVPEIALLDIGLSTASILRGLVPQTQGTAIDEAIAFGMRPSVLDTVVDVKEALNALERNIAALDEQINGGLAVDLGATGLFDVSTGMTDPDLSPTAYKRLEIISAADPGDMDQVVVSVVRLYYAGYVSMPQAAAKYDNGAQVCQGANITGVQEKFVRSVPKFNEAADTFRQRLSAVSHDLTTSGQAVVTAAKNYEYTDAQEAQMIQQLEGLIPEPGDAIGWDHYYRPEWLIPG